MYEPYKANRPDMPDDFGNQITLCKEIATQLQIPTLEVSGYEADDIMYTIAMRQHCESDHMVVYT
jgi:DNA polymerase-1